MEHPEGYFPQPYKCKTLPQEMEQIIVFLYDAEYCKHEADDPQKAVLFFHPLWVSEQQRLALCGQLMGAAHFCTALFSSPSVLTLQSGKFFIKKSGRYILSVGSDQSLPEWILKKRFETLQMLIEFHHCDLPAILQSVNGDHDNFILRLSQIFESYIPILQNVVTSVCSVPSIQYTNGNSSVFLEALQILEACVACKAVEGGVVLHNSKVVVSQLDSSINLLAALSDPYKIKNCAQTISVPFHLPVGVQLFKVFVRKSLIDKLRRENGKNFSRPKNLQLGKSMEGKRDVAKIFTVHEEEETHSSVPVDVVPKESAYMKLKNRRNSKHKSENNVLKERSKNYVANPNISVVSTPTVEKKLIHEEILSICSGKIDNKIVAPSPPIPDLVRDVLKSKPIQTTKYRSLRRLSMDDQMIDLTHKAYPIPLRYYSFGFPRLTKPDYDRKKKLYRCNLYKTLTDPLYPVFREDGVPVSKGLYNYCLDEHYKDFLAANQAIDSQEEFLRSKQQKAKIEKPVVMRKCEDGDKKEKKIDQKMFRRSLTLPLKPMTLDGCENSQAPSNKVLAQTPSTPLLAKLSLQVFEQPVPENKPIELPMPSCLRKIEEKPFPEQMERSKVKAKEKENAEIVVDNCLVAASLFVVCQGNMTMLLLIEEGAEQNPELVLQLWEIATANLDRVEVAWGKSMDHITQGGGSSSYSFLSLDPAWGTIKKYGAWGNEELKIVGSLHQDLLKSNNITELIVRNEDAVVYGYRCGKNETFYQQSGSCSVGLPTPADLMGVVTLKARRRLERDHGIVLL